MTKKIIEGVLITPPNYDARKKYPLAVLIHGGPAGVWAQRYVRSCWGYGAVVIGVCLGDLLDRGFVILQPNPRGSEGYGLNFRLANFGDFGGGDYKDIMSGVDYLIRKKIVDSNHMAVFGWSYGGYLTAWAITQTHRFKVAIEGSGLTDLISFSGTTDIPRYLIQFLGRPFWEDHHLYQSRSPIMFVQNIKTPLLIIGGENDIRVPFTQGKELYTALKLQKKPVELMEMKNQGHAPANPIVIRNVMQKVNLWFNLALK